MQRFCIFCSLCATTIVLLTGLCYVITTSHSSSHTQLLLVQTATEFAGVTHSVGAVGHVVPLLPYLLPAAVSSHGPLPAVGLCRALRGSPGLWAALVWPAHPS